jgi:hypothetical protein
MKSGQLGKTFVIFVVLTGMGSYAIFHVAQGLLPVYSFSLGDGNPLWQLLDYVITSSLVFSLSLTSFLFANRWRHRKWIALVLVPLFSLILTVAHFNFRGNTDGHAFEWTWVLLTVPALSALAFLHQGSGQPTTSGL